MTNSQDGAVVKVLERAKLCEGLAPAQITQLANVFKTMTVPAGTLFIKHDSQSKDMYLIGTGSVEIEIPVVGKQQNSSLARLKPGDSVGEFALLRDARRSATARAVSDVTLAVANSVEVLALFDQEPAMGYAICRNLGRVLADRLNDTNMQLRSELSRS